MIKIVKENYQIIVILIIASALRFYHIDFQSIWLDEIHTMNEANPKIPFNELYNVIMAGEQMPPFYFYSLYFLFKIFGYTTFVARVYSAILGVASVFSLYVFGKELINKQVGLIASFLLSINYFHLYYSQEARPYQLLLLCSILSFFRLILYIKKPTRKNAIIYGVISAVMIHSHFFGLFALVTQYLILFFFLLISEKQNKKEFFINSFLSGMITLILFIPAIKIFIKVTEIKQFWIPAPTLDVYTLIFKEFFGNSELLLTLIQIVAVFYFLKISKEKSNPITYNSIVGNKTIFSFVVLIPWIAIIILIPLIRSYTSTPMIISRYFIIVLPAIIVLISYGIFQFKNNIIRYSFISLFFIFSLTDTIIVKKYYKVVNKTQFREASQYIINNKTSEENIVTSLGWYMSFYLNNEKVKNNIIDKPLDVYTSEMLQDTSKIKSFWYLDGHVRPFSPSEETKLFLNQHFFVDKSIDLYDCYVKHYILKSNFKPVIDISNFYPLQQINGDKINFAVEFFDTATDKVVLSGWAYFDNQIAENTKIEIIAIKDSKLKIFPIENVKREDVTSYFKSTFDLSNSGFKASLFKADFEKGNYKVGILLIDLKTNKKGLVITDKSFNIQ